MDNITHCLLAGVSSPTAGSLDDKRRIDWRLVVTSAVAATIPDADIFIRSATDPLSHLKYHRHFTHSYAFAPVGALLVTLLMYFLMKRRQPFTRLYFAALVGYVSHILLDASTSYGTMIYWPFSDRRVAWDLIAIIDPIYTLILGVGLFFALKFKRRVSAIGFFLAAHSYLAFGAFQHSQIRDLQIELAQKRGHVVDHWRVQPTMGNLLLWRSSYMSGGKVWVDAFRRGWTGNLQTWEGTSAEIFPIESIAAGTPQRADAETFY